MRSIAILVVAISLIQISFFHHPLLFDVSIGIISIFLVMLLSDPNW